VKHPAGKSRPRFEAKRNLSEVSKVKTGIPRFRPFALTTLLFAADRNESLTRR
jgi:hypothetical protein